MPFVAASASATVRVTNPLAEDEAFLRGDLLTTLAARAEHNLRHMQGNVRLFEVGTAFSAPQPSSSPAAPGPKKVDLPVEEVHLALLVMGQREPTHFTNLNPPAYDEWDIKHLAELSATAAFPGKVPQLTPGSGSTLWNIEIDGRSVGSARRFELDAPPWASQAFGLEINLSGVEQESVAATKYRALPVTPSVRVDLALVAGEKITAAQIEALIRRDSGELLERVVVFDEFRGQGIPEGSRSLGWALTFRHPERTLKDREVQERTEKIVKALEEELGVRKR
jgi:phenylalanyl-tRNA synthetase beta chain